MPSRISARPELRRAGAGWLLLLLPLLAFHLWSLLRYPAPFVDEGWLASRAWGFLGTGWPLGAADRGIFDYYDGYWSYIPWIPTALQSVGFLLWPAPELVALRLVSLLFGIALLGAVYALARAVGGQRVAWVSVLLVALSVPFTYSAHLARTDIITATFGYVAVALTFTNRTRRPLVSFVSGLLFGLGLEIHLHLAVLGPPIALLYLMEHGLALPRRRDAWAFAVGIALGVAFYVGAHVLPYPDAYSGLVALAYSETHTPPLLTFEPRILAQALAAMADWFFSIYLITIPLLLLAVASAAYRGTNRERRWLLFTLVLLLGYALLIRNKVPHYAVFVTPAVDILVATFLVRLFGETWRSRPLQVAARVLCLSVLALYLTFYLSIFRTDNYAAYQRVQQRIAQHVRADDTLMGSQTYWFGFPEQRYFSWEAMPYYRRFAGVSLTDALRHFHPDLYIIDGHTSVYIHDDAKESQYLHSFLQIPKAELEQFFAAQGELVDEFEDPIYRTIRVYRIHWTDGGQPASPPFPLPPRPLLNPPR